MVRIVEYCDKTIKNGIKLSLIPGIHLNIVDPMRYSFHTTRIKDQIDIIFKIKFQFNMPLEQKNALGNKMSILKAK